MQPSDRSAKSAHLHTHLHTLLHTHTHTHTLPQSQAIEGLVPFGFPALPTPTSTMAPSSPPVFLRETQSRYPRFLPTPPFAFFSPSCFPQNWCVAVHGISMLESLWRRGFHRRRIGMGVDDINGFFFFFPLLPNKHPVIMIQFNHPCNICLRHTGGRLPGESRVWTGLPLGRFDAGQ